LVAINGNKGQPIPWHSNWPMTPDICRFW
jgi:hypothetical protein